MKSVEIVSTPNNQTSPCISSSAADIEKRVVLNQAGKEVYLVSNEDRLRRFLSLGSTKNTYVVSSDNASLLENLDPGGVIPKLVKSIYESDKKNTILHMIREFAEGKKCRKQEPLVYTLAACVCVPLHLAGGLEFRKEAYRLLPVVCGIPTTLFMFLSYCHVLYGKNYEYVGSNDGYATATDTDDDSNSTKKGSKGWNNVHKRAVCAWYNDVLKMDSVRLAHQVTKFKDRHGFTHRDVFRLCHIVPPPRSSVDSANAQSYCRSHLYRYIIKGAPETFPGMIRAIQGGDGNETTELERREVSRLHVYLSAYETLRELEISDAQEEEERLKTERTAYELITTHRFDREHVSSSLLNSATVWRGLVQHMPTLALYRSLNKLTVMGLLEDEEVMGRVMTGLDPRKCGMHPIQTLITLKTYSAGKGDRGNLTWTPNQTVVDALDSCFRSSFECNEHHMQSSSSPQKLRRRVCIAMDVSGSMHMHGTVHGTTCINAAEACCALAMVLKQREDRDEQTGAGLTSMMAFATTFQELRLSPRRRLDDNVREMSNMHMGMTDISLPFKWAEKNKKPFDAFIVMTDNETNANAVPPMEALRKYRNVMGIPDCKLIVLATASTRFTVADPSDPYTLDICGFDASVADVIHECIHST
jgi:60 kDa SS-A/Ro ribonucleoprotein